MATSTLTYIVLSFLAVSTQATILNATGKLSPLCARAKTDWWFPRILTSCCNDEGLCSKWINPNESKYGVTNPDGKNLIRTCSCDKKLYDCMTLEMTESEKESNRSYIFGHLRCFRKIRTTKKGKKFVHEFKVETFLDILPSLGSG